MRENRWSTAVFKMNRLHSWPIPALLVWALAWTIYRWGLAWGLASEWALAGATLLGILASVVGQSWWRRLMIGLGFPLSLLLAGAAGLPGWVWLLPLLVLALIYPLNAWRDAPLFPTPRNALDELAGHAPLAQDALILDAGCGLGDGLKALHKVYPLQSLTGIEWSWPLRAGCALRCPWARVLRGDMWMADWSTYDLVYLFQRPESMLRAVAKAYAELKPGAFLVSLEFEAPERVAHARLQAPDGRPVWIYKIPEGLPVERTVHRI